MKVGFIGLGTMGGGMASNLMAGGHSLVINDVLPKVAEPFLSQGALWVDSPVEVAEKCEVIFLSLPGPLEVKNVAIGHNGLIEGLRKGAAVFDLSTNSPTVVREVNSTFKDLSLIHI